MSLKQYLSVALLIFGLVAVPVFANDIRERKFNRERMEAFANDPEFNYQQDYQKQDSLLSVILAYIFTKIAEVLDDPSLGWLQPLLLRLFILGGIIILVIAIIKLRFSHVFRSSSKAIANPVVSFPGDEQEDYQKLLQESLANKNYKMAARYLFLTSLLILEQQKLISVSKWKTPYEYLGELPPEKKDHFQFIADLFENTWYGDHVAGEEAVKKGVNTFRHLQNA